MKRPVFVLIVVAFYSHDTRGNAGQVFGITPSVSGIIYSTEFFFRTILSGISSLRYPFRFPTHLSSFQMPRYWLGIREAFEQGSTQDG